MSNLEVISRLFLGCGALFLLTIFRYYEVSVGLPLSYGTTSDIPILPRYSGFYTCICTVVNLLRVSPLLLIQTSLLAIAPDWCVRMPYHFLVQFPPILGFGDVKNWVFS